jgi:uncharacterized phage protein gp47/JayE
MPLIKPTLQQIISRIETDLQSELNSAPFLDGSFLKAIANANAGAFYGLYGYLNTLSKEALPSNAIGEFLNAWANVYGVARNAGTYAAGNATFTGTNGTLIPSGTLLISDDDITYKTTAGVTIALGTATAPIIALAPGIAGNKAASSSLSLLNPIQFINNSVTVAAGGLTGGLDQETDDQLRERIINRIQTPPHGGNANDYKQWAESVSGVGEAYVIPLLNGAGTVGIYLTSTDENNIVPSNTVVTNVFNYISDPSRKPITASLSVNAVATTAQNFTIDINPDTPEIRANITNALKDLLARERKPADTVGGNIVGWTLLISKIREAVSNAAGENDNVVSVPSANVQYTLGQVPIMGTITWL